MSESDIKSKLPKAQADKVLEYLGKGWAFKKLDRDGEVMLYGNGSYVWIMVNGNCYP